MPLSLQTSKVLFAHIDLEDTDFRISPEPSHAIPEDLKDSIARVGLLHPPVLRKQNNNSQLVCGHRRLRAAHEVLAQTSYNCLVLPEDISEMEALSVALEDTLLNRPLSPMEQAIFFQKVLRHINEQEAAEKFLPLMGSSPSPYHIQNLLPLLKLEEPLAIALHQGFLNEAVARALVPMPFTDRMVLFEFIELLQLSISNQKKLTDTCQELAKRDNTTIFAILAAPEIQEIINHPEANPPQKAANLMALLTEKRSPRLTEAEKNFRKFQNSLNLPKNTALSHAQSFEKDTVTVSITFKDMEELQGKWPAIDSALEGTGDKK